MILATRPAVRAGGPSGTLSSQTVAWASSILMAWAGIPAERRAVSMRRSASRAFPRDGRGPMAGGGDFTGAPVSSLPASSFTVARIIAAFPCSNAAPASIQGSGRQTMPTFTGNGEGRSA